jgi:hypothetical protein
MKKRRFIWIPPAQTTFRQLAELNKQATYLRGRSGIIQSKRSGWDNIYFKKLVDYQAELSSLRNNIAHGLWHSIPDAPLAGYQWRREDVDYQLLERYNKVERLIAEGIERLAVGKRERINERPELRENVFTCDAGDFAVSYIEPNNVIEDAESVILAAVQARISEHLHEIQRDARTFLFKLRIGLAIDRRAKLRSIVQVIFKNLDDYDSENYVLRAA